MNKKLQGILEDVSNFYKEIKLPISNRVINIRPLTGKDSLGLSNNGFENITKSNFKNKKEFDENYIQFKNIMDNTILMVSKNVDIDILNSLCFLDYIYLFSMIRNISEGEDSIIISKKCATCDSIVNFEIPNIEELEIKKLENMEQSYDYNVSDIKFKFKCNQYLNFHGYMKMFLIFNSDSIYDKSDDVIKVFYESIFDIINEIEINRNKENNKFKIIKRETDQLSPNEVNKESFIAMMEQIPLFITKKLIKELLENQPSVSGKVTGYCIDGHTEEMEVTPVSFFGGF